MISWQVQEDGALNAAARARLLATYGYNAPVGDTYYVVADVFFTDPNGERCVGRSVTSFVLATATANAVRLLINAASETLVGSVLDAAGLGALRNRRFPLS